MEKERPMAENTAAVPETAPAPVYVVFPGKAYSQVWTFLWLGVVFLMSGLLPWGPGAPIQEQPGFFNAYDPNEPMGLARALMVVFGAATVVYCAASVWSRGFTSGASTANLLVGLYAAVELVLAKFWEHAAELFARVGAIMGTESEKNEFMRIYAERGPGYYLALIGVVVWISMFVIGIVQGSRKIKAREEAKKADAAAAAAERAKARAAASGAKA
jgi:hypothetical protein